MKDSPNNNIKNMLQTQKTCETTHTKYKTMASVTNTRGLQPGHAVASGLWAAGMISIILSYLILSYHHHHRHRLQGNSR